MKAVICFALLQEARPFLDQTDCRQVVQKKYLHYFSGDSVDILVSGMGATQMAAAMGWLFGHYPEEKTVWNVGTCGGSESVQGQWYRVVKVRNEKDERTFFPELIRKSVFPFGELLTLDARARASQIEQIAPALCDMEGYAFCRAAQLFVPSSRIQLLKWVSDSDGAAFYKSETWKKMYTEGVPSILKEIISETEQLHQAEQLVHPDISAYLEALHNKTRLTFTQNEQLKNALLYARHYKQGSEILEAIAQWPEDLNHSRQQKSAFVQLIKTLRNV